jgi:CheY-like chemotaxis protein
VAAPKHARRVLIVDENRDAAQTLAMLLKGMEHQVEVCYSGRAALESARRLRPDVIFLDLLMPDMDGFEVARQLRLDPGFQGTFIVAVTGLAGDDDRRRSREAGIDHHLVKPVDPEFIRSLLGLRGS